MPIHTRVSTAEQRVYATVSGEISTDEILRAIRSSLDHSGLRNGFDVVSDHRGIGHRVITPPQVDALLALLRTAPDRLRGSRWAIITDRRASFGMMRMLATHAESLRLTVRIFAQPSEAEEWLGTDRRKRRGPAARS